MDLKELNHRLKQIRLVIFDVDGVLTDGHLYYGPEGDCMKAFNARDGLGITRLIKAGLQTAIITGRASPFVAHRAADLGIQNVYQKKLEKLPAFEELLQKLQLGPQQAAYMGDDIIDMPVMERVGLAACPQDAMPIVKGISHFISQYGGGCGAVRELCDKILEAQIPQ